MTIYLFNHWFLVKKLVIFFGPTPTFSISQFHFTMNPSELPTGKPRQPSLNVSKESRKIIKNAPPLQQPPSTHRNHHDPPRVVYSVEPRVIHVSPQNFKDVVQRLTGKPPDNQQPARPGEVSPAARLASIQRTSPKQRFSWNRDDDMMQMLDEGVQMGQVPGILLPESSTLPPVSSENFSSVSLPSTPSYIFSPETFPMIPSEFYPQMNMPLMPSESYTPETIPQAYLSSNTLPQMLFEVTVPEFNSPVMPSGFFAPNTLPPMPLEVFPPVTSMQSQTVVSFNDVSARQSAFPPGDVQPQMPPNQFSPFDFD